MTMNVLIMQTRDTGERKEENAVSIYSVSHSVNIKAFLVAECNT